MRFLSSSSLTFEGAETYIEKDTGLFLKTIEGTGYICSLAIIKITCYRLVQQLIYNFYNFSKQLFTKAKFSDIIIIKLEFGGGICKIKIFM